MGVLNEKRCKCSSGLCLLRRLETVTFTHLRPQSGQFKAGNLRLTFLFNALFTYFSVILYAPLNIHVLFQ